MKKKILKIVFAALLFCNFNFILHADLDLDSVDETIFVVAFIVDIALAVSLISNGCREIRRNLRIRRCLRQTAGGNTDGLLLESQDDFWNSQGHEEAVSPDEIV
jgi:hypothetical protein